MRLLITGSRDWEDYNTVARGISVAIGNFLQNNPNENQITIVHGGCPTGADAMAHEFANKIAKAMTVRREKTIKSYVIKTEVHLADWNKYGNSAGPIRNKHMVELGADICVAFIKNKSRGASGTAKLAEQAGIEVVYYKA